jgi:rubrerythrin
MNGTIFCRNTKVFLAGALFLWVTSSIGVLAEETKANGSTLANLQAAYNGESNARAKYLAFAQKADAEGYTQAASLFRAAARAEEVHADAHAKVIRSMGGAPKADIKQPEVKSTMENLEAAIAGESYERDTMYPEFIKKSKADENVSATRTFMLAQKAEGEHAKLYKQALDNLEQWKGGTKDFYVCTVCGYTMPVPPSTPNCISCGEPKDKYVKVT